MAKYTDPSLNITEGWVNGEDNWDADNNTNLVVLRMMVLPAVADISNNVASPTDGDFYIVGTAGSGDFLGQDNNLAFYRTDTWVFLTPLEGTIKKDLTAGSFVQWTGAAWAAAAI